MKHLLIATLHKMLAESLSAVGEKIESAMKSLTDEAVYVNDTGSEIIIYDTLIKKELSNHDFSKTAPYILGAVELRDNKTYDTWEISRIWSKKGYGPLLYLLAMQESGNEGLMPSRVRSQVTAEAKNVWKQFFEGCGKDLVDYEDTEANHHEEDYLNKKYFIKNPVNISKPKRAHLRVIGKDPYNEKLDVLIETAEYVLREKMNNIYQKS